MPNTEKLKLKRSVFLKKDWLKNAKRLKMLLKKHSGKEWKPKPPKPRE